MHVFIDNYVNKIRLQLKQKYVDENYNINTELIISDMNHLKENSYDYYVKLLSILYPAFFILNEEAACDYADKILDDIKLEANEDYEEYTDDLAEDDSLDTYDIFEETEADNKPWFYSLDDVDNIYDFIDWIKIDENLLIDLFRCNFEFLDESYFDIRELLNEYKDCDPYLMDMSPLWYIDKYYYCHEITIDEINFKLFSGIKKDIDRVIVIDSVVNYINNIGKYDPDNYKKLVVNIINYSYKYQKYLLLSKKYESFKNIVEQSVKYIEKESISEINSCSVNDDSLYTILDYYFDFIESYDNNEKTINEFCDKNKCNIKQIKLN